MCTCSGIEAFCLANSDANVEISLLGTCDMGTDVMTKWYCRGDSASEMGIWAFGGINHTA